MGDTSTNALRIVAFEKSFDIQAGIDTLVLILRYRYYHWADHHYPPELTRIITMNP